MWRRLYFAFPTAGGARRAVAELERHGLPRSDMHTIARADIDLRDLPPATQAQRLDRIWQFDRYLWNGSLIGFALLLAATLAFVFSGLAIAALLCALLAVALYLAASHFAKVVPHQHLDEVRVPLVNGEVVLLVDVPRERIRELVPLVRGSDTGVSTAGVGWTPHLGAL